LMQQAKSPKRERKIYEEKGLKEGKPRGEGTQEEAPPEKKNSRQAETAARRHFLQDFKVPARQGVNQVKEGSTRGEPPEQNNVSQTETKKEGRSQD